MRWETLAVDAEMGIEEGVPCSICKGVIHDLLFFPRNRFEGHGERFTSLVAKMQRYDRARLIGKAGQFIALLKSDTESVTMNPETFGICEDCKYQVDELLRED